MIQHHLDPEPDWLASWVEHRLHETCPVGVGPARLYGLEFIDPGGFVDPSLPAGRLTFVDEGPDASALALGLSCAEALDRFDALALCVTRWEPATSPLPRPGGHPIRRRARVVTVVSDAGAATALRFDHDTERVEVWSGLAAAGIAGVQLAAMWSGRGS